MLVTSTALPGKQEGTKVICKYVATKIHFFYTRFINHLERSKRLMDTVRKYIKEHYFFLLPFPDEEKNKE